MMLTAGQIELLVLRMQDAFLDRPTLRLTVPQAERQFGVDPFICRAVLDVLVDEHVLARTHDGSYRRHFPWHAHAA